MNMQFAWAYRSAGFGVSASELYATEDVGLVYIILLCLGMHGKKIPWPRPRA